MRMMWEKLGNRLRIKSLRHYLTIFSIGISLISSLFIIFVINHQMNQYIDQEYQHAGERTLLQSSQTIQRDLDKVHSLLLVTQNNESILSNLDIMTDDSYTPLEKYTAHKEMEELLFYFTIENNMVEDILIITPSNQVSASGSVADFNLNGLTLKEELPPTYVYTKEDFIHHSTLEDSNVMNPLGNQNTFLDNQLFFASNLYNRKGEIKGVSLFMINFELLTNQLLSPDHFQIQYQDTIIFNGQTFDEQDYINTSFIGNTDTSFISQVVHPYDLTVIYNTDQYDTLNRPLLVLLFVIIFLVVYVLASLLSHYVAKTALRPITSLLNWIRAQSRKEKTFDFNVNFHPNRLSFRDRLFIYFLITILLPMIVISGIYYQQTSTAIINEMTTLKESELQSKSQLIDTEMHKVRTLLASYAFNPELIENVVVSDDSDSSLTYTSYMNEVGIESVSIYNQEGNLWSSTSSQALPSLDTASFIPNETAARYLFSSQIDLDANENLVISLPTLRNDRLFGGRGTVMVEMNISLFKDLPLIEMVEEEFISINDHLYWDMNKGLLRASEETSNDYIIYQEPLSIGDLHYVSFIDISDIETDVANIFLRNAYIYFLMIILLFILSYILTNKFIKPFNAILASTQSREPTHAHSVPSEGFKAIDEISELRQNFSESIMRLNQLVEEKVTMQNRVVKEEYEKKEIQLFASQNQVNPHFLYNTLESLLFLVETEETDRAVNMVNSLSRFFQYVTDRQSLLISIEEEIDFTKHYIEIMKVRFDHFEVQWEVDPNVLNHDIIKLILQPIVENSIHHGVRHTNKLVTIQINITMDNHSIYFKIRDNATGIEETKLKDIQKSLDNSKYNQSGIYNINDRLHLYYNQDYSFTIDSEENQGTQVSIKIPVHLNKSLPK